MHPRLVAQTGVLLDMKRLDGVPEIPHTPAFVLVHKLEMPIVRGTGDHTHGDLLGLTPGCKLGRVSWGRGVDGHTSRACA